METTGTLAARKARIGAMLAGAQTGLRAVADRFSESDWGRRSPSNEAWDARGLLVHLATAEPGFIVQITRMSTGGGGVPEEFDVDRWNASQQRRQAQASPQQLLAGMERAHQEMLALLETLDAAAFQQGGRLSMGGPGSLEDLFTLIANHKRWHTADLEKALSA